MIDIPLPEGITPQQAAAALREVAPLIFDLITQYQRGEGEAANARLHEMDHDQLKRVAGGLLGLAGAAVAGLAELGEMEPEAALALIAGGVMLATGELERRP